MLLLLVMEMEMEPFGVKLFGRFVQWFDGKPQAPKQFHSFQQQRPMDLRAMRSKLPQILSLSSLGVFCALKLFRSELLILVLLEDLKKI